MITEIQCNDWKAGFEPQTSTYATHELENGKVLLLPQLHFALLPHEERYLSEDFADPASKNISYHSAKDSLGGVRGNLQDKMIHKAFLQRFNLYATSLIEQLFPRYQPHLHIARTSFRPVEIEGRPVPSFRKDDTRLHVDAFPSSPNQGKRILRVFTNIHPHGKARHWRLGEPFEIVAQQFLPTVKKPWPGRGALLKALKLTKSYCTEYDYTMLQIHNNMKADTHYQKNASQKEALFMPGQTWIVQTDHVSHAAMAGQHVLEQTFYLPVEAMANPELSPLKTLERLVGKSLVRQ